MEPAAVTDDGDGGWEADGKERPKTSQLQRSVAFDLPSAAKSRLIPQLQPPVCFVCSGGNAKKKTGMENFTSNRLLCLSLLRASLRASFPPLLEPLPALCLLPPRLFADRLNLFKHIETLCGYI